MKKSMVICIIFLSLAMNGASPYTEIDPLFKFTEIAEAEQLEITGWEVTIKETKQLANREAYVNKFRNQHLVAMTEDENSINYVFEDRDNLDMKIQYNVIIPFHSGEQIELITVITGTGWDENIKRNYTKTIADLKKEMFTSNARIFTCIELIDGGTIESSMIIEHFLSSLELLHMEAQGDNVQSSRLKNIIYGYTPLWNESINLDGIPLNIQIATTELDTGDLKYMIGTPILINEY